MASKAITLAFEIGDEVASDLGLFLVDVSLDNEKGEKYLRVYIDSEKGVGLDECEAFSRAFEEKYDKADPIEDAYILEVSSPGVERILKTEREFKHFMGRTVNVKLYNAVDGVKEFSGVLNSYDNGSVSIATTNGTYDITVKQAAYIRLAFDF